MLDDHDTLYRLLPAYIQQQDLKLGGSLEELLRIINRQVVTIEHDLDRMYANWFIETCEEWVVPYLADLLGYDAAAQGMVAGTRTGLRVLAPRREVAHVIAHRRRKGTVALLEEIARDVTQWPARAIEFHQRIVVAQHLDHLQLARQGTADLRNARVDRSRVAAFDDSCRTADMRRIDSAESSGLHGIPNVGVFVFPMKRYDVTSTMAYCREDIGAHCFAFSALGNDVPLYRKPESRGAPGDRDDWGDLPLPIGRLELEHEPAPDAASASANPDLYGPGRSLLVSVDGWPKKGESGDIAAADVIPADLSDWAYSVPKNKIAVDPVRGRIMFPASQPPRRAVQVSYGYGFAMDLGGGQYARALPVMPANMTRARVRASDAPAPGPGEFGSIADALDDWRKRRRGEASEGPPDDRPTVLPALLVELVDSGVYSGRFDVVLERLESVWLVAAPRTRPILWIADESAGGADAISVRGARGSRFALDGILIAGRGIEVSPATGEADNNAPPTVDDDLCQVLIRHSTLVPGWGLSHDCEPRRPSEPSIVLDGTQVCLRVEHSIIGAIRVVTDEPDREPVSISIADSIVDATSESRTAIGAPGDRIASAQLSIARSSVVGAVRVHVMVAAENTLFVGDVTVARRQLGCVRYSYVPQGSRTPRRHRCQPDGVIVAVDAEFAADATRDSAGRPFAREEAALRATPCFESMHYGSASYLRLCACTANVITRGADDDGEMGVYHDLFEPQRYAMLKHALRAMYRPARTAPCFRQLDGATMNGDFSRLTFDSTAKFSQVLLQQGRVLLDADFNEQSAIHHHFLRTLIVDVVGRAWRAGDGFTLGANKSASSRDDFTISAGRYYVDGIMCTNEEACTYQTQSSWPVPEAETPLAVDGFMAFIECRERHVSAAQRPELREIALGGPDTASRAEIRWQVRTASSLWAESQTAKVRDALAKRLEVAVDAAAKSAVQETIDAAGKALQDFADALDTFPGGAAGVAKARCDAANALLNTLDFATPLLRASGKRDAQNDDPCVIAADARYRGRENQLYRVEIHAPGLADGTASFKWSRENASVVFRVRQKGLLVSGNLLTVAVESLGHDRRSGLCTGDWVELTSDAFEFQGIAPPLAQVTKVDRSRQSVLLTLQQDGGPDLSACTLLRRWDQQRDVDKSGAIPIVEASGDGKWFALERSIQVQFAPGGTYRTGDYWLIPARVASGDILWARNEGEPLARRPDGATRHRAALGIGKKNAAGKWEFAACGCSITPLCK